MKLLPLAILTTAFAGGALPAHAESLRCNGQIAAEGQSRLSVFHKCGEPLLRDTSCAPLYSGWPPQRVPDAWASAMLPCIPVEEWLYDRGPGNLMAVVRFRSGVVESIRYARAPE